MGSPFPTTFCLLRKLSLAANSPVLFSSRPDYLPLGLQGETRQQRVKSTRGWKIRFPHWSHRLLNSLCFFAGSLAKVRTAESIGSRDTRAQSARASHARRSRKARNKTTVAFAHNEFVLTEGFKIIAEMSKFAWQLHPHCKFDTARCLIFAVENSKGWHTAQSLPVWNIWKPLFIYFFLVSN